MCRLAYIVIALLLLAPMGAGLVGRAIGPGLLHPMRLNPERLQQTAEMLKRSGCCERRLRRPCARRRRIARLENPSSVAER